MSSARHSQLRWHCRRGIRELDLMLMAWLDAFADGAGERRLAQFARLLELQDPEIERYLLWGARPDDPGLADLVASIRELHPVGYVQGPANLCGVGPV